jgi:Na+/H+-dicarboxylate symporter
VRSVRRLPRVALAARIVVAVLLALAAGVAVGPSIAPVGGLGLVVVKLLKLLAAPLVFLAVVDAFLRLELPAKTGATLLAYGALNAVVATALGLGVARLLHTGARWHGRLDALRAGGAALLPAPVAATAAGSPGAARGVQGVVDRAVEAIPPHLLAPFMATSIVPLLVVAVGFGLAARSVQRHGGAAQRSAIDKLQEAVTALLAIATQLLEWVVAALPVAVFFLLASVVGKTGLAVIGLLGWFVLTIVTGLGAHALVYYPVLLALVARRSPVRFFRDGADAIVTALSCGSSLATLPVTLQSLQERHRVSPASARLAACIGTNLNHDGIILYEAAAALFVTQALGLPLSLGQQLAVAWAAILAGVGIAGVPEAGLLTLPLVLASAGVGDEQVARLLPLLFAVDWLVGRLRAATNVISDMVVAVLLDRGADARIKSHSNANGVAPRPARATRCSWPPICPSAPRSLDDD